MSPTFPDKTLTVSIETSLGDTEVPLSVPDGFIPITAIVPSLQSLGDRVQRLEIQSIMKGGGTISCKEGCAACCRMMIPVSPPEAFVLWQTVKDLPEERRKRVFSRIHAIEKALRASNVYEPLQDLAYSSRQFVDNDLEPLNRAYYALRMPCPFLEDETCSIYESRPSACRELLVTSPADLCQDIVRNPVHAIPVPIRISTLLGIVWSQLLGGPTRLIPLPFALEWAERNQKNYKRTWAGTDLMQRVLAVAAKLLKGFFREPKRSQADP